MVIGDASTTCPRTFVFFFADSQPNVPAGLREAILISPELLLCVGCDCRRINKQHIFDQSLQHFCFVPIWCEARSVSKVYFKSMAKKIPKRFAARTQPCLTPLCMSIDSVVLPLYYNVLFMFRWKNSIRLCSYSGHPILGRILNRPSLLSKSNAFVKSIKVMYRGMFCSLHFPGDGGKILCILSICWRESRTLIRRGDVLLVSVIERE